MTMSEREYHHLQFAFPLYLVSCIITVFVSDINYRFTHVGLILK
jgi:hypothetical protein